MFPLGNYVTDWSFHGFRDEEAITTFVELFEYFYHCKPQNYREIVKSYLQNGYYQFGDISVRRYDYTVKYRDTTFSSRDYINNSSRK